MCVAESRCENNRCTGAGKLVTHTDRQAWAYAHTHTARHEHTLALDNKNTKRHERRHVACVRMSQGDDEHIQREMSKGKLLEKVFKHFYQVMSKFRYVVI